MGGLCEMETTGDFPYFQVLGEQMFGFEQQIAGEPGAGGHTAVAAAIPIEIYERTTERRGVKSNRSIEILFHRFHET